jgi:hypothetical protein
MSSSIFASDAGLQAVPITSKPSIVCIDNSGSTSGSRMISQKNSFETLTPMLQFNSIIAWNTTAREVTNVSSITSGGGTDPRSFLPLLKDKSYGSLVIYTDGEIDNRTMEQFAKDAQNVITDIPVIIFFTVDNIDVTIDDMNRTVNMSIPETFLAISNNVAIFIVSASNRTEPRVLMTKGDFAKHYEKQALNGDTIVRKLPIAKLENLRKIVCKAIPDGQILIDGYDKPIVLDKLYNACEALDEPVISGLMDRMILPKLDLAKMRSLLVRLLEKESSNKVLFTLANELAEEVSLNGDSAKAKELRAKYIAERSNKTNDNKGKIALINNFIGMINDYNRNKTSIILSSNRANNATEINESDLTDIGICAVADCLVMYEPSQIAITIRADPTGPGEELDPTCDFFINCPFALGERLGPKVLPGFYGYDIAKNFSRHPLTRNSCHIIPLSYSPHVIIKHMAKAYTYYRSMTHLFRSFTAIIAYMINHVEFFADQKEFLKKYLIAICEQYKTTEDLAGTIDDNAPKVTMTKAIVHVINHYSTLLVPRGPDARSIMEIADIILPDFAYPKDSINHALKVTSYFGDLLVKYKTGGEAAMVPIVFNFSEDGYFDSENLTPIGVIARIFLFDREKKYFSLKHSDALTYALQHEKEFHALYNDEHATPESFAYDNPVGDHFDTVGKYFYEEYSLEHGLKNSMRCVYCGERFDTLEDKIAHTKNAYTYNSKNHLYNGDNIIQQVFISHPHATKKSLVAEVYNRLFKKYSYKAGFLMTKHSSDHIRSRIDLLGDLRSPKTP